VCGVLEAGDSKFSEAAAKLSNLTRPKDVADGARELKTFLTQSEKLRASLAQQTELDPHWMHLPLLRAAKLDDALVDGVRRYFVPRDRVVTADLTAYSIDMVQKTVKVCQAVGLLKFFTQGREGETSSPELDRPAEEIFADWLSFIERDHSRTDYEAVLDELKSMATRLVDHFLFGEFFVDRTIEVSPTQAEMQSELEIARKFYLAERERHIMFPLVAQGDDSQLLTHPRIAQIISEIGRVSELHHRGIQRLPSNHPRKIFGDLNVRANRILGEKEPPDLLEPI